jgi:hypothetical protein
MNGVGRVTATLVQVFGYGLTRYAEAIDAGERVLAELGYDCDESVKANLACSLAYAHINVGSCERALERSEFALVQSEKRGDTECFAEAIGARAGALFGLGRHQEAVMLARGRLAALAEAPGCLLEKANALGWLSILVIGEDPRESLSASVESADLARRAGSRQLEIWRMNGIAEESFFLGDWSDTLAVISELEQKELTSIQRTELNCTEAMLAALTGSPTRAISLLEERAAYLSSSEFVAERATYFMARSVLSLATGDIESARRESANAVSASPMGINSPRSLAIQAHACLWLREAEGLRETLRTMKAFPGRWMAAARLTAEAGLAALEGRVDEASHAYRKAVEAWRALDCTLDLALCELDMVLVLSPDHHYASAAKEARGIFTDLGAKPFLERLDQATGLARAN